MAVTSMTFIATLIFSSKTAWLVEGILSTLPFLIVGWGMYVKGKAAKCPYCGNTPADGPKSATVSTADDGKKSTQH